MSPTPRESGSGKKHKSVHRSSDDPQTIDAVVTQFFNNMRAVNAFGGRVTIKPISQVPQATQDEVKRILKEGAKMSGIDLFFGSHWRKLLCLYSRLMKRAGGVFDLIEEGDAEKKYPWKQCDMCAGKAGSICISLGKASDPDSNVGYLLGIPGQSISFGQSKSWQTSGPVRSAAGPAETSG